MVTVCAVARSPASITLSDVTASIDVTRREVNKVERFCEINASSLKITGTDPQKMIALAKKMAERDPEFTAAQLIGKDGAAMVG